MAQVVYNANGGTGSVPVDSTNYASGATVTVANNTGPLSKAGDVFLYWNTASNGSGVIHTGGSTFTITANITLYAVWGVTTGLTGGGTTTHYQFYYDPILAGAAAIEPARTNAIIAACETTDYAWLQAQFAGVTINQTLPIPTYVTAANNGGGSWSAGWGPPLVLNPSQGANAAFVRCLMMAEVSEMLMASQGKGWGYSPGVGDQEESCGEGLSLFLTTQFQIANGLTSIGLFNNGAPNAWLNTSLPTTNPQSTEFYSAAPTPAGFDYKQRFDYINSSLPWAGNGPGTGCSILFLYYLNHQLGFSIPQIIAAAPGLNSSTGFPNTGACLRGVYQNLTGDTSDPFPYFASLLAIAYPPSSVSSIPSPNTDDPYPIGLLSFVGAKNTWGKDEVGNIIGPNPTGTYTDGFYLAIDGFNLNILGSAQPSIPTIAFGGVTTARSAKVPNTLHQSNNSLVPQQIQFAYDVIFNKAQLGAFPASGETPVAVASSPGITVLGKAFPAATEFFFLAGADPYFTNVVSANTSVPWLSEDLRVFTATPGASPASQYQYPVPGSGAPQFVETSSGVGNFDFSSAYSYIQNLLVFLNKNYGDPSGVDPFDPTKNVIPQQSAEFTADSTVTPFSTIGGTSHNNYSFAIARVRLTGSQGSTGAATGVRVFFRLWGTQSADTQWDPSYTYLSDDPTGLNPHYPLAPSDNHTLPFFATSAQPTFSSSTDPEFQTGGFTGTGANNLTITIQQGDSQWSYFGCFLDVNHASVLVNGVAIPNAFPGGTHHCLVAQIAYPGAPIRTVGTSVPTPEGGDQLAQRNLQVTTSDNPGPVSAHRVPQTFEVKPSAAPPTYGPLAGRPDELMIDWGKVPPGSTARIYWPAVSSAEVIALASWMYGVHPLTAADAHTIEVTTIKGVTFVPIPQGSGDWYAGLFTVDLPLTVTTGQEFDIVVRRIGKRLVRLSSPPPPPPPPPKIAATISATISATSASHHRPGGTIYLDAPHSVGVPVNALSVNAVVKGSPAYERYIVGSFQVKIPVSTSKAMLPAEETTLAILKARLEVLPKTDRWYPVLLRFIDQIAGRVDGLGGNAGAIPPSLLGYLPKPHPVRRPCEEDLQEFTGKVCEVAFDCFGGFTGFVLDDCCERRTFECRERQTGELLLRALKERLTLMVVTAGKERRIVRLVVKS